LHAELKAYEDEQKFHFSHIYIFVIGSFTNDITQKSRFLDPLSPLSKIIFIELFFLLYGISLSLIGSLFYDVQHLWGVGDLEQRAPSYKNEKLGTVGAGWTL